MAYALIFPIFLPVKENLHWGAQFSTSSKFLNGMDNFGLNLRLNSNNCEGKEREKEEGDIKIHSWGYKSVLGAGRGGNEGRRF